MTQIILPTSYLAPICYYRNLVSYDEILIETAENYPKQTLRNRCYIAGANGVLMLTVPVVKPDSLKILTRNVRISDHGNWRHIHWNALVSAYNLSPFFEYYADDFRPFYEKKYDFLLDFNMLLQEKICNLLDIQPNVKFTDEYLGVSTAAFDADVKPYRQVFSHKHGFIPDLSIVDLLFNMGPEAILYAKPLQWF
ncbi:MAG: WbqC family protein [Tannerella sp.]|jgi:hypothetical protein|nr:WbqC family protein [Tannerella sp.]